jgi:hypothetical protein
MSKIGFYRYKLENATTQAVRLYVNNVVAATKQVVALDVCTGFRQLKFLDRNGQFRFYPFVAEHGIKGVSKEIGEVNEYVTSLLTSQSDKKSVGSNTETTITLRAANVSGDELEILRDIYSSPRVYYYVGNGSTDDAKDWVLVSVKGDGISRREKRNFGKIEIQVSLPKTNTITML